MPSEIKTTPKSSKDLQGMEFVPRNEAERAEAIEESFDYRGDVTIGLDDGKTVEGYLYNRNYSGAPPYVEMLIRGSDEPLKILYSDIRTIAFTGKDTADGRSWQTWMNKKDSERREEAETIKRESEELGHL